MHGSFPDSEPARVRIRATPFVWRPPEIIPPREWLYGRYLIKGHASVTIAPGGVGKSTQQIADAVAMVTGRTLLHDKPHRRLTVWMWNGEDDREEIERRVAAAVLYYGVDPSELAGRLFIDSGRDLPIKIAEMNGGAVKIAVPVENDLEQVIRDEGIDVLDIDPFISVHGLPENDNGAMDQVVKSFIRVAHRTGCAVDLVHHTRKLNGNEADIDSGRGGSAIAAAVRAARVLNPMTPENAKAFGIPEDERRSYVRVDDAKSNLAPPGAARWFRLVGEHLGNHTAERPADSVAVATRWTPPDLMAGIGPDSLEKVKAAISGKQLRQNVQAKNWVGHAVGEALGMNSEVQPDKSKIGSLVKLWIDSGALTVIRAKDEKGEDRPFVEVGSL